MTASKQNTTPPPNGKQRKRRPLWRRMVVWGFWLGLLGMLAAAGVVLWAIIHYGRDLPDYRTLANYEPAVVTRIHAGDGSLLKEYARQDRLFVPIEVVPEPLIKAFLSAEDKNFYEHSGLDYMGILRAAATTAVNLVRGGPLRGASTITQQVARNFLLTLDQKLDRKIKEMILTLRIERAYSKDRILELYLNEIYFGNRSYGVASAALNYFDKSLSELTVAQMAYLAAIPKGPNNYHPVRNHDRAVARRNWVLGRMLVLGHIDRATYDKAVAEPLEMATTQRTARYEANYFAEEVRREVAGRFGTKALYEGGLSVRTSLEPRLQSMAEKVLREGLVAYDRRHGWRGPLTRLDDFKDWPDRLAALDIPLGLSDWRLALVHRVASDGALIGLADGRYGFVPFETMRWARRYIEGQRVGARPEAPSDLLEAGDVVPVAPLEDGGMVQIALPGADDTTGVPRFALKQVPDVEGALVAMDPHTGRVHAMVGGFDYQESEFNRAVQAQRQPGSAFKPVVYAAALENGFTPASLVLDAPFVIDQGGGQGKWKPRNSSNKFYGPSTLRLGIVRSRNLMTVRLAQHLGMNRVMNYARRLGVANNMTPTLAASLGAGEVRLIDLTAAYGMMVNGGKEIRPTLIDRVQDRRGRTIYRADDRPCPGCSAPFDPEVPEPTIPDDRKQVLGRLTAYQLVSMLEGVVQNGTGRKIRVLGKPLAGKTGTTNDAQDGWFVGFSADLAVGVYVGFDTPRSLGPGEEGSSTAVPIWRDFMRGALEGDPGVPFRMPAGIRLVRINAKTGLPARPGDERVIVEAFKPGHEPRFGELAVLDGSGALGQKGGVREGTGGIY
ncbi:penicillin-binding protein 1A [Yunchengibacter salinarum]|uniref:penicillin-binding protein 1A n=1 Tax=Yunchengibacter salinarum TaxID=3133399 RepID=UPI0035B61EE2